MDIARPTTPHDPHRRRRLGRLVRWAVPVAVAGGVAVGFSVTAPSSGATPNLPHITAAQLIAHVESAKVPAFSGQISQTSNFGIPSLPGPSQSASLGWQSLLSGTRTARVWVDGPTRQRLAVTADLSEADVVHNGRDVWTYTSSSNTVSHTVLPAGESHGEPAGGSAAPGDLTPEAAASKALKAIDPTTAVTVITAQQVAGRDAYTLQLSPRDTRSTVRSVQIAVDATTYLPLRLQLFGAGSAPAFELGFTSIDYGAQDASTFRFTAPAGATTTKDPLGLTDTGRSSHRHGNHPMHSPSGKADFGWRPSSGSTTATSAKPTVIGSGWTSVVELHGGLGALDAHLFGPAGRPAPSLWQLYRALAAALKRARSRSLAMQTRLLPIDGPA